MAIENVIYAREVSYNGANKPMVVASSGGGGHIAAAQGLIQYLRQSSSGETLFTEYNPVLSTDSPPSPIQTTIENAARFMHAPYAGPLLQTIVSLTPYPTLPTQENISLEVESLNKNQERNGRRFFIDMLLDVCPAGHISVAIWNEQQRNDQVTNLRKLVALQAMSDKKNYDSVYNYFLEQLQTAANNGTPYTELISTQAMALPALCDTVQKYNQWLKENQLPYPKVVIHQYMTDLPTKGAVHFLTPLAHLTPEQQKQMKLYAVGLNEKVLSHFFPKGYQFSGVYNISAKENPMIRAGFKDPCLDNSTKFHLDTDITVKWYDENTNVTEKNFLVKANESIACIMLGSQAGRDTAEYIEPLLENGFDKIFVFGNNETITQKVAQLKKKKEYADKEIISLGNQSDKEIASLMTRSNLVIIRGGGLSVMEQLAMSHNLGQAILIHNANTATNQTLTSGISWEDGNVYKLIEDLDKKNIYVKKTSTELARQQISEAKLITALKVLVITRNNQAKFEKLISTMPAQTRRLFANLLNSTYLKENGQELQHFLLAYDQTEKSGSYSTNFRSKWLTVLHLALWKNELAQTAKYFRTPAKHEGFFNTEYLSAILINIAYHVETFQDTKNYPSIRDTLLRPMFSAINRRSAYQLKKVLSTACNKFVKEKTLLGLLNQLNSQIYFNADIDQVVSQLSQLPLSQQNCFFSSLKEGEKNKTMMRIKKSADLKLNLIASVRLEIRQKIESYIYNKKNNLPGDNFFNKRITRKKISMAQQLLSKINKLRNLNDQTEEGNIAKQLTKLLLRTNNKNKKMITRSIVSEDDLVNILKNGLFFLETKYPRSFQKGYEEVSAEEESVSLIQQLIFLIKRLLSKLTGKNKANNSPSLSTKSTHLVNTNVHTISAKGGQQKANSKKQIKSRYSFYQVPSDNNETNHKLRQSCDHAIHRASP